MLLPLKNTLSLLMIVALPGVLVPSKNTLPLLVMVALPAVLLLLKAIPVEIGVIDGSVTGRAGGGEI